MLYYSIKDSGKSLAAGPDDLTIHHLKNLGPLGLQYLTHLYSLSVSHCNITAIWKHAIIATVTKPNKPADLGTSYRLIYLLCSAVMVLERFLQP